MIVMKFGGTSVQDADAITRVSEIILTKTNRNPLVIASATAGTTDLLIKCGKISSEGDFSTACEILKKLQERHCNISKDLIKSDNSRSELIEKIEFLFYDLKEIVRGVHLISELSSRCIAKISSYGELLSTLILSFALKEKGADIELIDAKNFMFSKNNTYDDAYPDYDLIEEKAKLLLLPLILKKKIIITQGFIASTPDGITATFGRGGSDYSASILGNVLNAEEVEIWTDVDGIMTADPGKIPCTKLLKEISFNEAVELSHFGAKVLHPSTIFPVIEKNIPVRILNSFSPKKSGTLIKAKVNKNKCSVKVITSKPDITMLSIGCLEELNLYNFLKKIFEVFDKFETHIDLATISRANICVTINNSEKLEVIEKELNKFFVVSVKENKSQVCVIGSDFTYIREIAKKIFSVFDYFNISMISHGASENSISFVVDSEDADKITGMLHREFFDD